MLHSIILYVIHKCIDVVCILQLLYRDVCSFILHYLSLLSIFLKLRTTSSLSLKKLPTHLGIVICEENISFPDIASLIVWSFCIGIHHISIYDNTGYVKSNGAELYKQMNSTKEVLLKKKACSFNVIFSDGNLPFSYNISIKNGHKSDDIHVYLLSQEDGKQQIIEAARNVCNNAKREPKLLENFYAQHFNQYIKAVIDIPDPELILLFGQSTGLIGYLPWHIRLTEIMFQLSHRDIRFEEFKNALQRYSKCEQRFGK